MENLGVLIIDMQEGFNRKIDSDLIDSQKRLINYAKMEKIPLFVLEYLSFGKTIKEIQESLVSTENYFIKKYNDNAFIKVTCSPLESYSGELYSLDFVNNEKDGYLYENNELTNLLKERGIEKLILTGVNKSECVLKTAEGAISRGYYLITCNELMNEKDEEFEKIEEFYQQKTNHHKKLVNLIEEVSSQK